MHEITHTTRGDAGFEATDEPWFQGRSRRLARGEQLGSSLIELPPGGHSVYHFHHGAEELLVVLQGQPTLRTPNGERVLAEGEVVHFSVGPEGAHGVRNATDAPARYLMVSTLPSPEVVEYPDTRGLSAMAFTDSQFGQPLWDMRILDPPPGS